MCTSPLLIRNKKYYNLCNVLDKSYTYISVPCGECEECFRSKANSIYVRARLEYEHCLECGGCGFMTCLTYDDSNLPTFTYEGKTYLVFNKKHVIDFVKRLRITLERFYQKRFNRSAPSFKYVIPSEFGSLFGRPHYHPLFFFEESVSPTLFRTAFINCLFDRRSKKRHRFFGKILQCELIDPKKGGIHYCSKYVCKDIMFKECNDIIRNLIYAKKHELNIRYGINENPKTELDFFSNRCKRLSSDYKKAVELELRPLRHMLQFCLVSNDLGASCVVEKYGKNLANCPSVSFDGFTYALPPIVKARFEEKFGYSELQKLKKVLFCKSVNRIFSDLVSANLISRAEAQDLSVFVDKFCVPFGGRIVIRQPDEVTGEGLQDYNEMLNRFTYYDENDFFTMLQRINTLLYNYQYSDNPMSSYFSLRLFRYKVSERKANDEKVKRSLNRKNKGYE